MGMKRPNLKKRVLMIPMPQLIRMTTIPIIQREMKLRNLPTRTPENVRLQTQRKGGLKKHYKEVKVIGLMLFLNYIIKTNLKESGIISHFLQLNLF